MLAALSSQPVPGLHSLSGPVRCGALQEGPNDAQWHPHTVDKAVAASSLGRIAVHSTQKLHVPQVRTQLP